MASIMDGCYIPAKEIAQGLTPCAMRFVSTPIRAGIRFSATLKGNCYLTTLKRLNLTGAMLLGLPRYTLGRASVPAPKRVDATVNYGRHTVNTGIIAKRLHALTTVSIRAVLTTGKVR